MAQEFSPISAAENDVKKGYDPVVMVLTESEPFVAFDQKMDEALESLVAQWIHTAAPNASRAGRSRQQFGR